MSSMCCESSGLSYALANFRDDEYWVTVIVNAFYEQACEVARSKIHPKFRHLVSGSSIANWAAYAAFKHLSKNDLANPTAQDFERLLRRIIERKWIDRFRYHCAQKRVVTHSVPMDDAFVPAANDEPVAAAMANDLYEVVTNKLHEWHGHGLRYRLSELGILLHMSGTEIQRTLELEYPKENIPLRRAILLKLEDDWRILGLWLTDGWDSHDD